MPIDKPYFFHAPELDWIGKGKTDRLTNSA